MDIAAATDVMLADIGRKLANGVNGPTVIAIALVNNVSGTS